MTTFADSIATRRATLRAAAQAATAAARDLLAVATALRAQAAKLDSLTTAKPQPETTHENPIQNPQTPAR